MRNVLQIHSSSGLYGTESVIFNLTKSLDSFGFHSIICSLEDKRNQLSHFANAATERRFEVVPIACSTKYSPAAVCSLLRLVRKKRIRLIHSHYSKATLLAFFVAKMSRIPLLETNHLFPPMPLSDKKLQKHAKIGAHVLRHIDYTVAVSNKIKKTLQDYGVPSSKIVVIENGVDVNDCQRARLERDATRKDLGVMENQFVIGAVGRLTEQKGFEYLIEAAYILTKNHDNLIFLIAGDGPLNIKLKQQIENLQLLNYVKLLGFQKGILRIMSSFDLFVMPSIDEGLPMAMLEAMATKIPVIVSRVGQIPIIIKDKQNGLLIEARNSNQIAIQIAKLLGDDSLYSKLSRSAYNTVFSDYSNDSMARKYADLYNRCLKNEYER